MSNIANKITTVRQQITQAAHLAGRDPESIRLLAVSKTHPAEDIEQAYQAGLRHFGENYLQEAEGKIHALSHLAIIWHFIGPIQSNKTRVIAELFDWVQSIDRFKVAKRLSEQRPQHLPPLQVCLQVNISRETSKSGCQPEDVDALLQQMLPLPGLCIRGLMAIPKACDDPAEQQQVFLALNNLLADLRNRHACTTAPLDTLSMGMSADMPAAIQAGSTLVRVGTGIFGPRLTPSHPS